MERTLAIVKPDAVRNRRTGKIIAHLEEQGFRILTLRMLRLSTAQAGAFYEVHRERPFYASLVAFMTSGPCVPLMLEREGAVSHLRKVIGATDPAQAEAGTIRALYAESKERNAIHASDSVGNGLRETAFFFAEADALGAAEAPPSVD